MKTLAEHEAYLKSKCHNCDDIIFRRMEIGADRNPCLMVGLEVTVDNILLGGFMDGLSDVVNLSTMEQAVEAILAGNAVYFLEGLDTPMKVSTKGYPGMGVMEAETEKVLRGSREGFSDSVKLNSALVRKRIRSTGLKVEQSSLGVRSHTVIQLLYMEELAEEKLLETIKERLDQFEIDGVLESGMIEQLTEEVWYSPFPQFQTTERPDKAAMELLNGRIVLLCDNTPVALVFPTTFFNFMQVSEDRYHRFEMVSFLRMLRYLALFTATLLPGIYLAAIRYHTEILPTNLLLSFAEARAGVPFSSVVELVFLELSFELIREAGVHIPGALGNAIGIVGGLIVGQATVEANLVSPIVVIIVALTALGSLAVPNEEFAAAFRMIKYVFLFLGGYLGMLGLLLGIYTLTSHLASLRSFGIPYLLVPEGEGIFRRPFTRMNRRPVFARDAQKIRLKKRKTRK